MSKGIDITPNLNLIGGGSYPEIKFSGTNSSAVKILVSDDGGVSYNGSYGTLSTITDNLNGVIKTIYSPTGPLFQVRSDDYVQMGKYSSNTLVVNSNRVGVGVTAPSSLFHIYGSSPMSFRLDDGNQQNGYFLTSDSNGVGTWKKGPTAISSTSFNGTLGYLSRFTATSSVGDSIIYNGQTTISIGTVSTSAMVVVAGTGSTSSTTSGLVVQNSSLNNILSVRDDGYVSSNISNTSSKLVYGGIIYNNTSISFNSSTGSFVNLYDVPFLSARGGFILKNVGDKLKSVFSGEIYATSSSTQQIKISVGGVDIFQSGVLSLSGQISYWKIESMIMATNYTNLIKSMSRLTIYRVTNNHERISVGTFSVTGFSSDSNINVKVNTTGGVSDIIGRLAYVEYYPSSISSTFSYVAPPPPVFNEFRMTIDTAKPGSSSSNYEFTVPLNGGYTYSAVIQWGDGNSTSVTSAANATYTYLTPGVYQIRISGDFPSIHFASSGDRLKVTSIDQWGDIVWGTMEDAFNGCENMVENYSDYPNLSGVTSLSYMFRNCYQFNGYVDNWDTSNVYNMGGVFYNCLVFNQSINNWNTSNVYDMNGMFYKTPFDNDVSSWDVSNVANMTNMFRDSNFNQQVSTWNVANLNSALYFMNNISYNPAFLRDIYNSWGALPSLSGCIIDFSGMTYLRDISAPPPNKNYGKDKLTSLFGWSITDGGPI